MEVGAPGPHPAEVQGIHRPEHLGGALDVVGHDQRHRRRHLEVIPATARVGPVEPFPQGVTVEAVVAGGVKQRQPAVAQLARERDVVRSFGRQVDRYVVTQRMDARLQWFSKATGRRSSRPLGQRKRIVRALIRDRAVARPDVAQDPDVLARAREWLGKRLPVPPLHDLWSGHPQSEDQPALRQMIERHRCHCRCRRRAR